MSKPLFNQHFALPKKRDWELVRGSEKIMLLKVNDKGDGFELVAPWRWECHNCGEKAETPTPDPPIFCYKCNKKHFKRLFPPELLMVWDKKWRVPWLLPTQPETCDFTQLYEEVKSCIRKHVVFKDDDLYEVLTCWILASWKAEYTPSCPYLLFRGEHESGKTRALEVLTRLAYRAVATVGLSPALLFRQIEGFGCTCLIDQAEDELDRRYESGAMKYAVVASGYKQGMYVGRVDKQNPNKVKYFETYGFKALASTKSFDMALDSRCIIIDMEEATPEMEDINEVKCRKLRAKLLYWRLMDIPYGTSRTVLKRRTRELFLPLLWVAKLRGVMSQIENFGQRYYLNRRRELPDEFRAAIINMVNELTSSALQKEDDEAGRIYLSELKEAFQTRGWEKVSSQRLGRTLSNMDIKREGPVRGKGRYVDITNAETERKINYYLEKFGLKTEIS